MQRKVDRSGDAITRAQFLKSAGMLGMVAGSGGLLAACGGGGGNQGSSSGPVGISVSHYPSLLYSVPWAVAIEQGYFKDRDIELDKIVGSSGGGTTVRNVVTGGLPIGAVATPAAINAFNEGSDLKIIGGAIANTSDISFVTLPEKGVKSIEDLSGKKVGFTEPGSITQGCIVLSLKKAGIPIEDVKLQAMGGLSEALTGLKEGAIDVAPQLLPIAFSTNKKEGFETVFQTKDYVGNFAQLVMIASSQAIEEQADLLKSLIEMYQQSIDFTLKNPEKAAAAWAKNSEVSEGDALKSLKAIKPDAYYSTALDSGALNTAVDEMREIELLESGDEVKWDELLDQQFLSDDKQVDTGDLK